MRRIITVAGALALFGVLVASVGAGTIVGTKRNDVLRGTAKGDKLYGQAGNDKLYGLAGNDYLNGGLGNDVVSGGPGADVLVCGPGRDTAIADAADKVAADCETVLGLPKPAVSVTGAEQAEGNAGSQPMSFSVSLAKASRLPVTVAYATADGSATAGTDYTATSGKLVFAPGETSKAVAVPILGDTGVEPDETFTLTLSNPVNAKLGGATATGTIKNDDVAPRSGHYAGTTSQGKPIGFDVSADGKSVSNLTFGYDLNCTEVQGFTVTGTLRVPITIPINPDFSFGANDSNGDASGKVTIAINGKLSLPGSATGTLQIALEIYNIAGVGTLHCQTGGTDVTWTAQ
jgi:hypothetical protein